MHYNDTTYYVWVRGINSHGAGGLSPAATGTPLEYTEVPSTPAAPAVSIADGQLTVSWQSAARASAYEVWLGTQNDSDQAEKNGSDVLLSHSKTITGLSNGTTYYVWVKAKNSVGISGFSPVSQAKPVANMGAVTLAASGTQITASWQAVLGTEQYAVYYGTDSSIPASPWQTVTQTSVAITGLASGTTYYVWVKPINAYGAGAVSAAASAVPLGTPAAPTLTADNGKLIVSWQAVTGATQYEIYCGTETSPPDSPAQTVHSSPFTLTELINGTYYVCIKAKNSTGVGDLSPAASVMLCIPGLYKGAVFATAEKIGTQNLEQSLSHIASVAQTGDNYFIVLGANQDCAPKTLSYSNNTVGITLMADGLERMVQLSSNGLLFAVRQGVTLTLQNNVTLTGRAGNTTSLISVYSGGTFIMNGGKISGNTASAPSSSSGYGGGVQVAGTFTMNGGSISGNTSHNCGGGVAVFGGTFTLSGGSISGNTASAPYYISACGGGVYVAGTFTMSGGEISGNTASSSSYASPSTPYGGGVYVSIHSTFTKSTSGVIYGNNASPTSLKNNASGNGDAVYRESGEKKRNSTIPAGTAFDSSSSTGWQ